MSIDSDMSPVNIPADIAACANQVLHEYESGPVGPSAALSKGGQWYFEEYLKQSKCDAVDDMRAIIIDHYKTGHPIFDPEEAASFMFMVAAFEIAIRERCKPIQ